ncbi:MAG: phosphotransacetylase family protein [Candidatus Bathyarchaeia archaeon]
MPNLFVSSPEGFSGKTAICLGLALTLRREGYKVGYFKPIGTEMKRVGDRPVDEDVSLMKAALNLDAPVDALAPVIFHDRLLEELVRTPPETYMLRIEKAFEKASSGMDLLIVESTHKLSYGCTMGLSGPVLAKRLGSHAVLVSRFNEDAALGDILCSAQLLRSLGVPCMGVILNDVDRNILERVKGLAAPLLQRQNVEVLGIIPRDVSLTAPTAQDVYAALGGEVLATPEKMSNLVESFVVGAMTPDSALSYFRRAANKAVITGGDRSDVALAALETSTSMLILTGNLYPNIMVLAKAEEKGVPVLLVPYDTYTTVEKLSRITGRVKPEDEFRIRAVAKHVEEHVNWRKILDMLLK